MNSDDHSDRAYIAGCLTALCVVIARIIVQDNDDPDRIDRNIAHTPGLLVAMRKSVLKSLDDPVCVIGSTDVFVALKELVDTTIAETSPGDRFDADYLSSLAEAWDPETFLRFLQDAHGRGSSPS